MNPEDARSEIGGAVTELMRVCGEKPLRNFAHIYQVALGYLKRMHGPDLAPYLSVKMPKIPRYVEFLLVTHAADRRYFYVLPVSALPRTAYLQIPTHPKLWGEVYRDRFDLIVRLARGESLTRQIATLAAAARALGKGSQGSGARAHMTGKPKKPSGKMISVEELDRAIQGTEAWEERFRGMGGAAMHMPEHLRLVLGKVRYLIDHAE